MDTSISPIRSFDLGSCMVVPFLDSYRCSRRPIRVKSIICGVLMRLHTLAIVFFAGAFTSAAATEVSSWSLATGIGDRFNGVGAQSDMVQNPFVDEHHVTLGASQAASYFDFSWTPDTASFLIAASNVAFDGNGGTRSISTGNIYLTPHVDILITATGTYDYDLPAWAMQVAHGLDIYADSTHLYSWGNFQNTFLQGPITGTFQLSRQGILPAGSSVTILYAMYVDAFGNSGLFAEGHGSILITLQPVPEPQMVALFALAACLMRRKASRR